MLPIVERIKAAIEAGERFVRIEHRDGLDNVHLHFVWAADYSYAPDVSAASYDPTVMPRALASDRVPERVAEIVRRNDGHRWIDLATVRAYP